MAKEILGNEKFKKTKKLGEGIYSEDVGNALNIENLKEEYLADCDVCKIK